MTTTVQPGPTLLDVAAMPLDPWPEANALAAFRALAQTGRPFQPYEICLDPFGVELPTNPRERSAFLGSITAKALAAGLVVKAGRRERSLSPGSNGRKVDLLRGPDLTDWRREQIQRAEDEHLIVRIPGPASVADPPRAARF